MNMTATTTAPTRGRTDTATVHPLGWGRFLFGLGSRWFLGFCGSLLVMALVPLAMGWKAYLVPSGSMRPSIAPGDLVIGSPVPKDQPLNIGLVVVADDANHPGRTKLHRIVNVMSDGSYITQGDANHTSDAQSVQPSAIHAVSRLRIPFIGLPEMWLQQGEMLKLLALALAFVISIIGAIAGSESETPADDDNDQAGEPGDPCGPGGPGDGDPDDLSGDNQFGTLRWATFGGAMAAIAVTAAAIALPCNAASAAFSARVTDGPNTWTTAVAFQPYAAAVRADNPSIYWLLDETTGTSAADFSGNGKNGTYTPAYTMNQADGLATNAGTAVLLGAAGRIVCNTSVANPTALTLEMWFKTNTTTGGKLIGFESTTGATSPTSDRLVYMRNNGRIVYGGWGANTVITTPAAKVYNDNVWHHLVVTATGASGGTQTSSIYIDGALTISGTTTATTNYTGFWRVGSGTIGTGGTFPTSATFAGTVDHIAVYTTVLTSTRIAAHYAAR
ncbi:MAG: hypothetical protein F2681_12780 [Actinobacteria bacterium]|uniref:Unannotated protein n=2 Tax=freshwater metagenome TaxID=449393 RepID=A0A6J6SP09_9ZZZZ|nr:hypothetical protein [Actinomycetota bacterium]MSZ84005.1 hypothetical protein [Actinomycetota bacterium]